MIDDSSKHLIGAEVLSRVVKNEKIEIGEAPTDSKYNEVEGYYIPRTFNRQVKIKEDFQKKKSRFLVIIINKLLSLAYSMIKI